MKSVLLSVRPEWVAKILNGKKTIEIRKKFPSDYVGWVYIYCTKEQGLARLYNGRWNDTFVCEKDITDNEFKRMYSGYDGKGKVVCRFWCGKVEEIKSCIVPFTFEQTITDFYTDTFNDMDDLLKASCLDYYSLEQYLKYSKTGYAIHITKLEIFDKPKEISEFRTFKTWRVCNGCSKNDAHFLQCEKCDKQHISLTKAPQSWCYVEI